MATTIITTFLIGTFLKKEEVKKVWWLQKNNFKDIYKNDYGIVNEQF